MRCECNVERDAHRPGCDHEFMFGGGACRLETLAARSMRTALTARVRSCGPTPCAATPPKPASRPSTFWTSTTHSSACFDSIDLDRSDRADRRAAAQPSISRFGTRTSSSSSEGCRTVEPLISRTGDPLVS